MLSIFILFSQNIFAENETALNIPLFKECQVDKDSIQCSKEKWLEHLAEARELIKKEIPYKFKDSIVFKFSINSNGKIKVKNESAFFSGKAKELLKKHLLKLSGQVTETDKDKIFSFGLQFEIGEYYSSFPDIENVEDFPIYKECKQFNSKGKRACFRYLVSAIEEQIGISKEETEILLHFSKGKLVAMRFNRSSADLDVNEQIFEIYNSLADLHLKKSSRKKSDNFRIKFDYRGSFRDSTSRRNFRFNKLRKLASSGDPKWFTAELFHLAKNYYPLDPVKSKFILDNLKKYGFSHLTKVWDGGKYISVKHLEEKSNESLNFESQGIEIIETPPLAPSCVGLSGSEEILACFNRSIAVFISKNYEFPNDARRNGHQGKVFVNFVIEKDGEISNIEVVKGIVPSLDFEAIRVISLLWDLEEGAVVEGNNVRSLFTIPFNLKLK